MDLGRFPRSERLTIGAIVVMLMVATIAGLVSMFSLANKTNDPLQTQAISNSLENAGSWGSPYQNEKEYWESRGAIVWLPWIKRAVDEGVHTGVILPTERVLFENLLLGVVGVEAGGANPFIKRPHGLPEAVSSDGLMQLIRLHLWSNENPFDPLTNLRAGLRTLARYYRGYDNRWDLALMEHLTGDVTDPNKIDDAGLMKGGAYPRRVIEINKMARKLLAEGDLFDDPFYFVKDAESVTRQGMSLAPPWHIFDSPDLPFNWTPPPTSRAYELLTAEVKDKGYFDRAAKSGVKVLLGNGDNPGQSAPGPSKDDAAVMFEPIEAPTFEPRPPTPQELAAVQANWQRPAVDGVNYAIGGFKQNLEARPWYKVALDAATRIRALGGIIGPFPPAGLQ